MMMKKASLFFMIVVFIFSAVTAGQAEAQTYTGSLSANGGGITATDGWDSSSTSLSWQVSNIGSVGGFILWQYDYLFDVPEKNISHVIIEVSPNAQGSDFTIVSGPYREVNNFNGQGNSNVNIPEAMWGIKFGPDEPADTSMSFSFTTTRAPVWGDFYAKDGRDNPIWVTAWNDGFTSSDTDPAAGPTNGSLNNHILRPNTIQVVPEPISSTLFIVGAATLGYRRFRGARKI